MINDQNILNDNDKTQMEAVFDGKLSIFVIILGVMSYLLVPFFIITAISTVVLMYAKDPLSQNMGSIMLLLALGYFMQGNLLFVFKYRLSKNRFNIDVVKKVKKQLKVMLIIAAVTICAPIALFFSAMIFNDIMRVQDGVNFKRDVEINAGSVDY